MSLENKLIACYKKSSKFRSEANELLRYVLSESESREKIAASSDAVSILKPYLAFQEVEHFYVIMMNRANKVISVEHISSGGICGTVVDCRVIFKRAIETHAAGIILAHNHPSGNINPSEQDIRLTKSISEAAKLLELRVLDHVIITNNSYYSFADEGKL